MYRARKLGVATSVLLISCISFNVLSIAVGTATAPAIHAADYNMVNTGAHPITPAMIFPNDTSWKDPKVECLIITDQSFVPAFQPLADLKTSRGVYTIIMTIQSIYMDARFNSSGIHDSTPQAAYIRNAIKHYHANNGTEFVILGGDINIVPIRYVYNPDTDEQNSFTSDYRYNLKPTDHYYACLEGTWDSDGDGKYGEMGVKGISVDEVDWTAEVYVGRIPANTPVQAQNMVQKIITYETNPPAGSWINTAVFAGAISQYSSPTDPPVDEAKLSEFIIDSYFARMTPVRLYQHTPSYIPPSPYTTLSETTLRNTWNLGAAIVNLAGHGNPTLYTGDGVPPQGLINAGGAALLSNGGKLPFVYIFSCSSGAFDYMERTGISNSLSEQLMLNTGGGAIGVVSALRTTYYFTVDPLFEALNEGQNRFFWREFITRNEYQPGRALYLSQQAYIEQFINKYWNVQLNVDPELAQKPSYIGQEEKFRKNLLTYNLLGDPEIAIYTRQPETFAPDTIPQNASIGDTLMLEITDKNGLPVPGARVLINGSGYYITGRANALGIASIRVPHDPALINVTLNVTISGHNMRVSRTSIFIFNDTRPPTMLQVDVPAGVLGYKDTLRITSTGIDAGSGLRYAFIIFVKADGNPTSINQMSRISVDGNRTTFECKYPGALPPGQTLLFYVIAFDASGNYIIACPSQGQYYSVAIASRVVEDILVGVLVIGTPVAVVLIVSWFVITRRRHQQQQP